MDQTNQMALSNVKHEVLNVNTSAAVAIEQGVGEIGQIVKQGINETGQAINASTKFLTDRLSVLETLVANQTQIISELNNLLKGVNANKISCNGNTFNLNEETLMSQMSRIYKIAEASRKEGIMEGTKTCYYLIAFIFNSLNK